MPAVNCSPKVVQDISNAAVGDHDVGSRAAYNCVSRAHPRAGDPIPPEGLTVGFTADAMRWLRKVGIMLAVGNMPADVLVRYCEDGDEEACEELDRRGVEAPMVEAETGTDSHADEDLTELQRAVLDGLAEAYPTVRVSREGSGVVLAPYLTSPNPDGSVTSDRATVAAVVEVSDDDAITIRPADKAGVHWAGRNFGELSVDERNRVSKWASGQLERELEAAAPELAKVLDETAPRRLFLSGKAFWSLPRPDFADLVASATRVEGGYEVNATLADVEALQTRGIGIVNWPTSEPGSTERELLEGSGS